MLSGSGLDFVDLEALKMSGIKTWDKILNCKQNSLVVSARCSADLLQKHILDGHLVPDTSKKEIPFRAET